MTKHICTTCGHVHDVEKEGPFENLPKYYNCPVCGTAKEDYEEIGN